MVVTNVSGGGKEVKEVRVPIWSDKNGQMMLYGIMLINSQMDYKVHVDTASHKGDTGTYSVHLYYMLMVREPISQKLATVPQSLKLKLQGN
ncbi:MAG: GBS Bsp-like repeat-containing protein [Streptococcus sp.]